MSPGRSPTPVSVTATPLVIRVCESRIYRRKCHQIQASRFGSRALPRKRHICTLYTGCPKTRRQLETGTIYQVYLTVWFNLVAGPFTGLESIVLLLGAVKEKVYSKAIESEFELRQRIAEAAEFVNNGRFARARSL
ncbi:hypothetical protein EVAR_4795_1 [Eumeta japonica]|uniref:Uncharacterized protein n=1 Tax=Eumeta variegata TaxID=151549 RepID=A0A4C1T1R2_EUMVA|nr:hypothetical protein EVAR_4795_1 [Eumeta japonica]